MRLLGKAALQLGPRTNTELRVDFTQVVLDGVGADEEPCAYFRVRQAVSGHPCNLSFLASEFCMPARSCAFPGRLAGGL